MRKTSYSSSNSRLPCWGIIELILPNTLYLLHFLWRARLCVQDQTFVHVCQPELGLNEDNTSLIIKIAFALLGDHRVDSNKKYW
ncbi:hypothetical protein CPB83DRAFT_857343 [Crepidotus variabilis]|uniref:Uncharacterized protein n=1 Tax=Crepidotus variabilis TaxID=179855 RepID=A0A9P6JN26_9AGAR|nr:hypothetical protein CPB83DRAFT_857343 [Crepidotus variabilis]